MSTPATETKPSELDVFLARQPAHLHEFYTKVADGLSSGLCLHRGEIAQKSNDVVAPIPMCSPFRVTGLVQAQSTQNWSRVVELLDPKGQLVECVVPEGRLTGKPRDAIAMLSDRGLRVIDDDPRLILRV